MQNFLVISALGEDKPGIVQALSETIKECGCNISDSRMTVLGGEFALIMLLSGTWDAVAKVEGALGRLESKLNLTLISKRTNAPEGKANMLSYMVEVVAMDHPGIARR
ncbi:MAG: ACT domain-containing protein [Pseudomonadota bacterium]